MEGKTISDSSVAMSIVMQPNQANPAGNVHGGEIMKLMDNAAFVVAQRHARTNVVTARVDELVFHQPVYVGNLVTCYAFLTFVSRSSMEVMVTVEVENLYSEAPGVCALTGYFTMVALNAGGQPMRVAPLELVSEEERLQFEEGQLRHEANRKLKAQHIRPPKCLAIKAD
ncbi:MAG: acyl-CoA thioesterase [Negativicutes bacterium]|nr:acyl-CoA thioesterase [Negativicutes bacterium]